MLVSTGRIVAMQPSATEHSEPHAVVGWLSAAVVFSLRGVISNWCAQSMRETAPAVLERQSVMSMSQHEAGTRRMCTLPLLLCKGESIRHEPAGVQKQAA